MFPAAASVMTQAISSPYSANAGHARRVGQREGDDTGAGRSEQRIDVAVVAAGELDHAVPAGRPAGQPDRRHRRLGSGVDQAHLLDRPPDSGDQLLGQFDLPDGRRAEGQPVRRGSSNRLDHRRVGVAVDHGAPRRHEVDVLAPVGVSQVRPATADHEPRGAADRPEGPHRRVHPARRRALGALEQFGGAR
jgi:hypothetical protein